MPALDRKGAPSASGQPSPSSEWQIFELRRSKADGRLSTHGCCLAYSRVWSGGRFEEAFTGEGRTASVAGGDERNHRTAVSRVRRLHKSDLCEPAIVYLFVNGIDERLRPGQRCEAVLAAWGIGENGRKSLLVGAPTRCGDRVSLLVPCPTRPPR
jgi:hypothetical protein